MLKPRRGIYVATVFGALFSLCGSMAFATGDTGQQTKSEATKVDVMTIKNKDLPERKQTTLGLYVTSQEAYAKWQADPARVRILDVRTPEEYIYVGHAEMARNIPIGFVKHQWDSEMNEPVYAMNAEFISAAKSAFSESDTILVTCRSGARSALAVNALAKAGFTNAYNIIDGVEGAKEKDPNNVHFGKRTKNGWKNSGSPWTYDVDPEMLWTDDD